MAKGRDMQQIRMTLVVHIILSHTVLTLFCFAADAAELSWCSLLWMATDSALATVTAEVAGETSALSEIFGDELALEDAVVVLALNGGTDWTGAALPL